MKKTVFLIFFLFLLTPLISKAAVVINEVAWMGTVIYSGDEWVELYNDSDQQMDLTGWILETADGTPTINLSGNILAKGYFLLERTDDTSVPGILADQIYTGALGDNGEYLKLKDNNNNVIDEVNCSSEWLTGDKTTKQTMEKTATSWQTSLNPEGTPKAQNSSGAVEESESTAENPTTPTSEEPTAEPTTTTIQTTTSNQPPIADAGDDVVAFIDDEITFDGSKSYDPDGFELSYEWNLGEGGAENDIKTIHKYSYSGTYLVTLTVFDGRYYVGDTITVEIYPKKITINEFLPSPEGKDEEEEWIELYNDSDQIADISGWQLDDEDSGSKPFVFPKNTLIAPQSYLVFSRKTTGIALNNDKDKIRLLLSGGVVFQEINYEKAPQGLSSSRTPEDFVWTVPTPGLPNIINSPQKSEQDKDNRIIESLTTKYSLNNTAVNYKSDSTNQIEGGWTYNQEGNQKQNLIANLGEISQKTNYKFILAAAIITIIAIIFGAVIIKLKREKTR